MKGFYICPNFNNFKKTIDNQEENQVHVYFLYENTDSSNMAIKSTAIMRHFKNPNINFYLCKIDDNDDESRDLYSVYFSLLELYGIFIIKNKKIIKSIYKYHLLSYDPYCLIQLLNDILYY
jgi:hypothetical protein